MAVFKKKSKANQEVPTSALPDIIFILLFFFMTATKVKTEAPAVRVDYSKGTQLNELDRLATTFYVYIGIPKNVAQGSFAKVQLNGAFVNPKKVGTLILDKLQDLPSNKRVKSKITIVVELDKNVAMGKVIDVQESVRKAGFLNIMYKGEGAKMLLEEK